MTTSTAPDTEVVTITQAALAILREKIAAMAKKAKKLGMVPPALLVHREYEVVIPDREIDPDALWGATITLHRADVAITGSAPRLPGGWRLVATIDHTTSATGNIVNMVPDIADDTGAPVALPEHYRTDAPTCDHCHTSRRRNDTFVLISAAGTFARVGRNCLQDFLGGTSVEQLLAYAQMTRTLQFMLSDDDFIGGYGPRDQMDLDLRTYLTIVCELASREGFVSSANAKIKGIESTGSDAWELVTDARAWNDEKRWTPSGLFSVSPASATRAGEIIAWAQAKFADARPTDDYTWNMHLIVSDTVVKARTKGFAASLYSGYIRDQEYAAKRAAEQEDRATSTYVGTIGKRQEFSNLTLVSQRDLPSEWGATTLYTFADPAGNTIKWFASSPPVFPLMFEDGAHQAGTTCGLIDGTTYTLKATIKTHKEYQGAKETTITRAKVSGSI